MYNSNGSTSKHFRPPYQGGHASPRMTAEDAPLDAFDMELLAEVPRPKTPAGAAIRAFEGVSLPSRRRVNNHPQNNTRTITDDLRSTNRLPESSSSPFDPFSNPTVSALEQRKSYANRSLLAHVRPAVPQENRKTMQQGLPETTLPLQRRLPPASSTWAQNESRAMAPRVVVEERTDTGYPRQQIEFSHAPPVIQGIPLVEATELPDQLRSLFKHALFNAVQSKCFEAAFRSDDNLVLSAPTGSGKTAVMELAICRVLTTHKNKDFKIIYQAPTKSLCTERYQDWQSRFGVVDLQCAELTGDTDFANLRAVQSANVIITTPEKWDSVTRKWTDHAKLMRTVKLFLVDEVHILKESRGATLEAVVSRMKYVSTDVRFIALSATVPNSEDVASWLGKNGLQQHLPARREVFGEEFRPVKLEKHVYGYNGPSNDFAFEKTLTKVLPEIIARHAKRKPIMIFCSTRRICSETSLKLVEFWNNSPPQQRLWNAAGQSINVKDPDLKNTVKAGVGFHHGGMDAVDRHAVEQGFLGGQISIICSTGTLAVGINLPCYLVILKGTFTYHDNKPQEYSDLEVMQMLGRAGRPQFEKSACAAILTRSEKVDHYQRMISGQEVLESCLHQNLIEHLNAEIGLGTIVDTATAEKWLAGTFLSVRLERNPNHYRLAEGVNHLSKADLLQQICAKDITLLREARLVEAENGLKCTEFGSIMARYYVKFETMKLFMTTPPRAKLSELLNLLVQAQEFREIRMRAAEKSLLKDINKDPSVKYPIKVDIALQEHRVSLIIQAELGGVDMRTWDSFAKYGTQLALDKTAIFGHANRLIRCLIDCQIAREDGVGVRNALELGRSLAAQVWDNTAMQLRQLEGIGPITVRKLAAASINSLETLCNTEAHRIELALGKSQPFGHQLLQKAASVPNLRVSVSRVSTKSRAGGVELKFQAQVGFINQQLPSSFRKKPVFVCFLAESATGALIDFRRFGAVKLKNGAEFLITTTLMKPVSHINCYVMCDEIAGTSRYAELGLSDIRASEFPDGAKLTLPVPQSKVGADEEFEDCGIEDSVWDEVDLSVVQDIDNIIPETKANTKRKRYPSNLSLQNGDNQAQPSDAEGREPVRMVNGRWTCRHDCNEKKKHCKHKCCREGVEKLRAPQKKAPKGELDDDEDSTSNDTKRRKLSTSSNGNVEQARSTSHTTNHQTERKTKTKPLPASSQQRKLSFSSGNNPLKKEEAKTFLSATDVDSLPPTRSLLADSTRLETKAPPGDIDSYSTGQQDSDYGDLGFDDCDWAFTGFEGADLLGNADTAAPTDDSEATSVSPRSVPVDMGGFEAPLSHVAMHEVERRPEKGMFVIGDSSSPDKASATAFEAELSNGDSDFHSNHAFDHLPTFHEKDDTLSFGASNDAFQQKPAEPLSVKHEQPNEGARKGQTLNSDEPEKEEERQRRAWKAEQRGKWEGIDPMMYEMFGDIVELV